MLRPNHHLKGRSPGPSAPLSRTSNPPARGAPIRSTPRPDCPCGSAITSSASSATKPRWGGLSHISTPTRPAGKRIRSCKGEASAARVLPGVRTISADASPQPPAARVLPGVRTISADASPQPPAARVLPGVRTIPADASPQDYCAMNPSKIPPTCRTRTCWRVRLWRS